MATATYSAVIGGPGGSFQIRGGAEVAARLRNLAPAIQRRIARRAVRAGATVWRDAAVQFAARFDDPTTPNRIARNIAIRESGRGGRAVGGIHFRVGVLGGSKRKVVGPPIPAALRIKRRRAARDPSETFYWRYLEFGTRKMKAQPFLRPAYNQNIDAATDAVVRVMNAGLDRLAAGGGIGSGWVT